MSDAFRQSGRVTYAVADDGRREFWSVVCNICGARVAELSSEQRALAWADAHLC